MKKKELKEFVKMRKKNSKYICWRCHQNENIKTIESTIDLRTLRLGCFYDMSELDIPLNFSKDDNIWWMRICKPCRGDFMITMTMWFNNPQNLSNYSMMKHITEYKECDKNQFDIKL